jgi:hypothetical protein
MGAYGAVIIGNNGVRFTIVWVDILCWRMDALKFCQRKVSKHGIPVSSLVLVLIDQIADSTTFLSNVEATGVEKGGAIGLRWGPNWSYIDMGFRLLCSTFEKATALSLAISIL